MHQIKRILHPTDFSPNARTAFQSALTLARRTNARLHLLHVAPTFGEDPLRNAFEASLDEDRFYQTLRDEMDQRMKDMMADYDADSEAILRIHSRGPSPAPVIVEYARDQHIDLIVLGTHGRRGVRRMLLGSVSTEVVRSTPCDVLTIPNEHPLVEPESRPFKILVPVDLSSSSSGLLKRVKDLAWMLDATVDVLFVMETIALPTWGIDTQSLNQWLPSRIAGVKATLKELVEDTLGEDIPHHTIVEEGYPAREIVKRAREDGSDLIVLAPRGTGWLDHLPLGSVSDRVITEASGPVYLIQHPVLEENQAAPLEEARTLAS